MISYAKTPKVSRSSGLQADLPDHPNPPEQLDLYGHPVQLGLHDLPDLHNHPANLINPYQFKAAQLSDLPDHCNLPDKPDLFSNMTKKIKLTTLISLTSLTFMTSICSIFF